MMRLPGTHVSGPEPPVFHSVRSRQPGPSTNTGKKEAPGETPFDAPAEKPLIRCRSCGHGIADPDDRIAVDGAHIHTFANPHGIVFEIGCFSLADGCTVAGRFTDDFSWFRGFQWRLCACSACLTHLGWEYASTGGSGFFGLILDNLLFPDMA